MESFLGSLQSLKTAREAVITCRTLRLHHASADEAGQPGARCICNYSICRSLQGLHLVPTLALAIR